MKPFLTKLVVVLLPVIILVILVNYFVDPANIFSSKNYQKEIADILSKGNNVDNISNYDERLLQEQMVLKLHKTPEVIILGSSRIMEVGKEFFSGKTAINCAVSHANIKDIIAVAGLLDSAGHLPEAFVLNVDAGLICNGPSDEWKTLQVYYDYFLRHYPGANEKSGQPDEFIIDKRISSLFSIEYFQSAVEFFLKKKTKKIADIGKEKPLLGGRFSDGTVAYNDAYMNGDAKHISAIASETGKKLGVALINDAQQKLLILFLDFCEQKNIIVQLTMLPYHPSFYAAVNEFHEQAMIKYEDYFRELAKTRKLQISGSFNPGAYQLTNSMFYDMYHPSKQAIKKILINN